MSIDHLRQALSSSYQGNDRFQMKQMNDAAEVYEAILESIHHSLTSGASDACSPECLAHKYLYLPVQECDARGGATMSYTKAVEYVSVTPLLEKAAGLKPVVEKMAALTLEIPAPSEGSESPTPGRTPAHQPLDFCQMLGAVMANDSPKEKNDPRQGSKLLKDVEVLALGLTWPGEQIQLESLESLVDLVSPVIDLSKMYDTSALVGAGPLSMVLRGMICYYGHHYIAFVFNPDIMEWTLFDDTMVRGIGSHWHNLTEKCINGHYQPSLLFYQKCDQTVFEKEMKAFLEVPKEGKRKVMSTSTSFNVDPKERKVLQDEDEKLAAQLYNELNQLPPVNSEDERLAMALQEEWNKAPETPISPEAAEAYILERKVHSRLHQLDAESRTGFVQSRLLVRFRPVFSIFVTKPKEKIAVLFQNLMLIYHSGKPVNTSRPEISIDLFKSNVVLEDTKEFRWRLKRDTILYEFVAPNREVMDKWTKGIQKALSATPNGPAFTREHQTFTLTNGEVYHLDKKEDKLRFIEMGLCPCGNEVTFTCGCQIQGYCSSNCESAHLRFHSPVCIKTLLPAKPL